MDPPEDRLSPVSIVTNAVSCALIHFEMTGRTLCSYLKAHTEHVAGDGYVSYVLVVTVSWAFACVHGRQDGCNRLYISDTPVRLTDHASRWRAGGAGVQEGAGERLRVRCGVQAGRGRTSWSRGALTGRGLTG